MASTDSSAGHEPGETPDAGDRVTSLPNHSGKVDSNSAQTFNGSQTMNSHNSGSAAAVERTATSATGTPAAGSGGAVLSKGLLTMPPSSGGVIQAPLLNSDGGGVAAAAQAVSQAPGHTVTLIRQPMQTPGSSVTLNGNNSANSAAAAGSTTDQAAVGVQTNNAAPHIIKAEPPTTLLQSSPQPVLSAPQPPSMAAGGLRAPNPQMLAPRLPQTSTGQPSVHNIQLPPGMVLVRSESGQLLMIPQQALAQMQAQAQGGMAPRPSTPTNMPLGQSTVGATPVAQRTLSQPVGNTITTVTVSKETLENVKKCKNFLATLIKLASSGKQSSETAASVRELIKELLEGKVEAEEFTSRLYKELNSSPQPYLVPFLKRSLPALRQLTPDSAAFIQQSQHPQAASGPVSSSSSSTVVQGSPAPRLAAPAIKPQLQPATNKPGHPTPLLVQSQQRTMLRPQLATASTPMMAVRNQVPARIIVGQQQVQLKELQPVPLRPDGALVSKQVFAAALTSAQRNKLKEAGGTFKDDDDINDVASMAGVNLSEESANILATNSGLVGAVTHSCKDEAFLSCAVLQRRMLEISKRHGVTDLGTDVVTFISHATQQRLQNLLEKVSFVAQQKNINLKESENYEQSSDVRAQLKFFEQLDQLEKQRKEEQEREILLKAAKSRARQEDPEQLRLKQKAKEMQQQELAQMRQREANLTALAAIGPRKKRKNLDSPSSSASAEVTLKKTCLSAIPFYGAICLYDGLL
uniref:TAF4A RNA polymerase II, TATA box binding protein (TBP)-associated factor n=1 Tax=Oryzias latipes TaxID=8090 RepID=A0A3P9MMR8_ORYLA